ncbi:MAG TPA: NrsF family protein [Xanthobacteraceae bacterium]|jgi:hypothetical protein
MNTDQFIRALSADLSVSRSPLDLRFAAALLPGFLVALALFAVTLGPRPDFAVAIEHVRFIFKFVITLLLALCSALLVRRLARPGAPARRETWLLVLVPAVLIVAVVAELVALPSSEWRTKLVGENAAMCLLCIPFFALPILIAALGALRAGAPTRPSLAGAIAGLLAGALGAAVYAAHCPDDSPLFVAAWYSIAIAGITAVGAIAGRAALRW